MEFRTDQCLSDFYYFIHSSSIDNFMHFAEKVQRKNDNVSSSRTSARASMWTRNPRRLFSSVSSVCSSTFYFQRVKERERKRRERARKRLGEDVPLRLRTRLAECSSSTPVTISRATSARGFNANTQKLPVLPVSACVNYFAL